MCRMLKVWEEAVTDLLGFPIDFADLKQYDVSVRIKRVFYRSRAAGEGETTMTRRENTNCSRCAEGLSAYSYYYFMKVCFAGLYFASRKHTVRIEQPEDRF